MKLEAKVAILDHHAPAASGGAAERARGLADGFRAIGAEVVSLTLPPDTRLRSRRPGLWWYHRMSAAELAAFADQIADADALVVCYLPVAYAAMPLARWAAQQGIRVIYSADNDEVAVAHAARPRRHWRTVAEMQRSVLSVYPEAWVAGSRDAASLAADHPDVAVREVPSGVRGAPPVARPVQATRSAFTFGSWTYPPNVAGLHRLTGAVPIRPGDLLVYGRVPKQLQQGAGRAISSDVNVRWGGFAPSIEAMVQEANGPGIVPVWSGAGTKLRVVELAERAIPIVAPAHAFVGLPTYVAELSHVSDNPDVLLEAAFSCGADAWDRAARLREKVLTDLDVATVVARAWETSS